MKPMRILLVEDNPGDADLIRKMLPSTDDSGFTIHCVSRLADALSHLEKDETDIALLDLDLPDCQGTDAVRLTREAAPETPIVVMTGNQNECVDIAALQDGAQDFLIKGQTHQSHLSRVIRYAVQRHCAEKKMRKSERFLRATIDALSAQIAIIDASGRILTTNKAWRNITNTHGEHVMRSCENTNYFDSCRAIPDKNSQAAICAKSFADGIRAVLENKKSLYEQEYPMNFSTEELWFHGRVTPIPYGYDRKVVVAHDDITKRKRAQEEKIQMATQLRHTQKMEAIGTLAGGIAHDFNNILASVIGYVELSLLDLDKDSQLEKNLKEVYHAGKRAQELVQQILTFAQDSKHHIQPTQVCAIAEETAKLIRSSIPTSIEVRLTVESEAYVMAESTQIHQIFMNLFTNAAQAMDRDSGVIEVKIAERKLNNFINSMHSVFSPGNYLQIVVSDTGTGISRNELEKIFEPYFTTKGGREGTGLGLSVVHGIVRNHRGEIEVESKVGQGTKFTVYLPLSKLKINADIANYGELPKGSEHILFVDDELPIAEMSRQRLGFLGYTVTAVSSSSEALRHMTENADQIDLIITDLTMPRITGEQLAIKAKKIKPNIPIILCTGYSKKISKEKAAAIGISAFLMKPVSLRDMAETIRNVLRDGHLHHTS